MNLCACGCGGEVRQGRRFLPYHHLDALHEYMGRGPSSHFWKGGRIEGNGKGYVRVWAPDHPRADSHGYVREHVLVAEAALGRYLVGRELVHHVDESRRNNSNDNLVICPDDAYHALLHQRKRALDACGNANWRRCSFCHQYDDPTNDMRVSKRPRGGAVHRSCAAKWMREYKGRQRHNNPLEAPAA